jgi:hypothetical protein
MGIPVSLFLIAAGAILAFAVTATSSSIDVNAVGWILMATGFVGLLLSLILWDTWAGGGFWARRDAPPPRRPPKSVREPTRTRPCADPPGALESPDRSAIARRLGFIGGKREGLLPWRRTPGFGGRQHGGWLAHRVEALRP